jgi:hypothetical protein
VFTIGPKAQATTLLGHQKALTQEGEGTSMGAAGSPWPTKQTTLSPNLTFPRANISLSV